MEPLQHAPPDQLGEGIRSGGLFMTGETDKIFLHEFLIERLPDDVFRVVQKGDTLAVVAMRGLVVNELTEIVHLVVVRLGELIELIVLQQQFIFPWNQDSKTTT